VGFFYTGRTASDRRENFCQLSPDEAVHPERHLLPKEAKMINLTPHPISIATETGIVTIPPSGTVARVTTRETQVGEITLPEGLKVPVFDRTFGEVEGLPPEGESCLVSALVLSAVPGRKGVYAPDTGSTAIRGQNGQIQAVTRLISA